MVAADGRFSSCRVENVGCLRGVRSSAGVSALNARVNVASGTSLSTDRKHRELYLRGLFCRGYVLFAVVAPLPESWEDRCRICLNTGTAMERTQPRLGQM